MSDETAVMQLTVNETIRRFPRTVEVFHRYGIDSCCGGGLPVVVAAEHHGADAAALHAELLRAIGEAA